MIHENSDVGIYKTPLAYRPGLPLNGLMTLQNFIDGGYDVIDAKVLVVVKSIGARKRGKFNVLTYGQLLDDLLTFYSVTRKDETVTQSINLHVEDDTAEATLGLWGTAAVSPLGHDVDANKANSKAESVRQGWKVGETVLLIQAPGWKIGRSVRLDKLRVRLRD